MSPRPTAQGRAGIRSIGKSAFLASHTFFRWSAVQMPNACLPLHDGRGGGPARNSLGSKEEISQPYRD